MIIFKTIKFKNFLSFGNQWTEIDLTNTGTTFIVGENLDEGGSSGAGKSTLINAISYCLFDKIQAGISKDKLINLTNAKKNTLMEVCLVVDVNGVQYTIRRWRGVETGVQLLMTVNNIDTDITPASVNRGDNSFNVKVEELVGFSFSLFSQIIMFNGNSTAFLDQPVSAQRSIIEELFKITMLSRKAVALKRLIAETDKAISLQKLLVQQQEKQNEVQRKHIAEAADRVLKWENTRQAELREIQTKLENSINIDFDTEETIHLELNKYHDMVKETINQIKVIETKRTTLKKETSPDITELKLSESRISQLQNNITKLNSELKHLRDATCPYCLQHLDSTDTKVIEIESKIESIQTEIETTSKHLNELTVKIKSFNDNKQEQDNLLVAELSTLTSSQTETMSLITEISANLNFKDISSLHNTKQSIALLQSRLESMLTESNPHVSAHQSLLTEGEIVIDTQTLDDLIKQQEHQQFLHKLLTDKNSFIRKNIIAKTIPFLNKRILFYTEKLLLPHIVTFQPDMSCAISQYGRNLDHGNLSNGEKKRLNMSLCLAFRDVLTYLHNNVNVLFTDEIDGGSLDGNSIDALISLLKQKAWDDQSSVFIISHRPEFEGRCDQNIIVRKDRGFSTLILQPEE